MQKFRKRPVVIEAIRWTGNNLAEVLAFTGKHPKWDEWFSSFRDYEAHVRSDRFAFQIHTLEGVMEALPGDWVIRGVKGEHYPCKPDIFEATYEPADALAAAKTGGIQLFEELQSCLIEFRDLVQILGADMPMPDELAQRVGQAVSRANDLVGRS